MLGPPKLVSSVSILTTTLLFFQVKILMTTWRQLPPLLSLSLCHYFSLSLSLAKEEEEEETLQTPTLGRLNQWYFSKRDPWSRNFSFWSRRRTHQLTNILLSNKKRTQKRAFFFFLLLWNALTRICTCNETPTLLTFLTYWASPPFSNYMCRWNARTLIARSSKMELCSLRSLLLAFAQQLAPERFSLSSCSRAISSSIVIIVNSLKIFLSSTLLLLSMRK